MSESSAQSPLARLVLFMVCLAILGSIVAGVLYFTIGDPEQNLQQVPENSGYIWNCRDDCQYEYGVCQVFSPFPPGHCEKEYDDCLAGCS
jgi:hypothetical protein